MEIRLTGTVTSLQAVRLSMTLLLCPRHSTPSHPPPPGRVCPSGVTPAQSPKVVVLRHSRLQPVQGQLSVGCDAGWSCLIKLDRLHGTVLLLILLAPIRTTTSPWPVVDQINPRLQQQQSRAIPYQTGRRFCALEATRNVLTSCPGQRLQDVAHNFSLGNVVNNCWKTPVVRDHRPSFFFKVNQCSLTGRLQISLDERLLLPYVHATYGY